jgi:hypothetical protein
MVYIDPRSLVNSGFGSTRVVVETGQSWMSAIHDRVRIQYSQRIVVVEIAIQFIKFGMFWSKLVAEWLMRAVKAASQTT